MGSEDASGCRVGVVIFLREMGLDRCAGVGAKFGRDECPWLRIFEKRIEF
jgi:hypothetical protein